MKSSTILIAFGAALVGGVAGALLVSALSVNTESVPTTDVSPMATGFEDAALRDSDQRNSDEIQKALGRLGELEVRIERAEAERDSLKKTNSELKDEVTTLKNAPKPESGVTSSEEEGIDERVDRAVDEALQADRDKKAAAEKAAGLKQVDRKMQIATDGAVKKLEAQLGLTRAQSDQIALVFDRMNQRVLELTEEAGVAKESGLDFDWTTRWGELMTETEGAIRNELSSAQLGTFDEMIGDDGLSRVLWSGK